MAYITIQPEHQLYYHRISGKENKPLLVFLHEGLGCAAMWKGFPAQLCYRTGSPGLVYDRHGYGQSSLRFKKFSPNYMHESAAHELPQLLQLVAPGAPYILIGHSDGGTISLIHAAGGYPRCRAVITEAAHVFVEEITIRGVRGAVAAWNSGKLRAALTKYHKENTETVFRNWSEIWLSEEFRTWNIEGMLPKIKIPTLVIQGADDSYGSLNQVAAIARGIAANSRSAIIADCGHAPHRDHPEQILSLMTEYLSEL